MAALKVALSCKIYKFNNNLIDLNIIFQVSSISKVWCFNLMIKGNYYGVLAIG